MPVTASEAKRELARRELARRQLARFAWYTYRQYVITPLHALIAHHLEQVERYVTTGGQEGIGRLMIFCPPRHGKSELVSVRFPAWFLGRNPDRHIILVSCTTSLSTEFSRKVRNLVMDTTFRAVFGDLSTQDGVSIAKDSRAADMWALAGYAGGLTAAGVGGAIIGRGAHVAIIDDPFRDRADAQSKRVRDRVDDWYRSVLYSRLEQGGAIVLMHQRWHEDDLAGRLLRRMADAEGDDWTVLSLPAIAEEWAGGVSPEETAATLQQGWYKAADALGRQPGEALWPGKYPIERLYQMRKVMGGYEFDALEQQRPRQLEGAMIKAHRIPIVETVPDNLKLARYWDLAVSRSARADWLSGALVGQDIETGRLYILDVRRMRGPWADARPKITRIMLRDDAAIREGVEVSGQQGGYHQELQRDPKLLGRSIEGVNPQHVGSKEVRAQVWASRIEDNLVWMLKGPWNETFIEECLAFPLSTHDDQVDGVSGAVQMLSQKVVVSLGTKWKAQAG